MIIKRLGLLENIKLCALVTILDHRFKKKGVDIDNNANAAQRFLIEEANNSKIESQESNYTLSMASINNMNDEPSTSTHANGKEKRPLWTLTKVCHLKQSETSQVHDIIEVKWYL